MATLEVDDIDDITTDEDLFYAAVKQEVDVTESRSPTFTCSRIKQELVDYDETSTVVGTQAVEADMLLPPVEIVNVDSLAVNTEWEEESEASLQSLIKKKRISVPRIRKPSDDSSDSDPPAISNKKSQRKSSFLQKAAVEKDVITKILKRKLDTGNCRPTIQPPAGAKNAPRSRLGSSPEEDSADDEVVISWELIRTQGEVIILQKRNESLQEELVNVRKSKEKIQRQLDKRTENLQEINETLLEELVHVRKSKEEMQRQLDKAVDDNDELTKLNRRLQYQLLSKLEGKSLEGGLLAAQQQHVSQQSQQSQQQHAQQQQSQHAQQQQAQQQQAQQSQQQQAQQAQQQHAQQAQQQQAQQQHAQQQHAQQQQVQQTKQQHSEPPATQIRSVLKIDIGSGVMVPKDEWADINSPSTGDSQFCKKLAVAIWGEETLAKRTVEGKPANRKRGEVCHPALTPEKVSVIKNHLRLRLREKVNDSTVLNKAVNACTKYLNEKICTIRRAAATKRKAEAQEDLTLYEGYQKEMKRNRS